MFLKKDQHVVAVGRLCWCDFDNFKPQNKEDDSSASVLERLLLIVHSITWRYSFKSGRDISPHRTMLKHYALLLEIVDGK